MNDLDGLARLTGYLRALLASGQPLPEGLAGLARALSDRQERELLEKIRSDLSAGAALSASVAAALGPSAAPLLITLLRAGETSGRLPDAVAALAGYYGAQRDLERQLRTVLLYPRVAAMVMVALVFPTLAWVQSQLASDPVFQEGTTGGFPWLLDVISRIMLFPFQHGRAVSGAVIAASALALFGGFPPLDRLMSRIGRRLFAAGALRRTATAAALARGLSLLSSAGVPVPDALRLMAGCTPDLDARRQIEDAARRAETGLSAGQALQGVTALPPSFPWFLGLSDPARPDAGFVEAARFYEEEARDRAQLMANAAQPLIVLALAVAFLPSATVLARLLKIVSMTS